jgi:ATP-binding cassette subfamily C protein LapB
VTAARDRARRRARGRRPVDRPAREGLRLILSPPVLSATIVINLLSVALPVVLLQVYDRVIPNQSVDTLALLVIGLGIAFALDALLRTARAAIAGWAGARYEFRVGNAAVERLLHADQSITDTAPIGVSLDRLAAVDQLRDFYANHGPVVFVDLPFALLFLLLVHLIAGPLVAVPLLALLLFGACAFVAGRRLRAALSERAAIDDRRMNFIIELLAGIHTAKALGMEALMMRRYERLMDAVSRTVFRTSLLSGVAQGIGAGFMQVTSFAVAAAGSLLVLSEDLTIGGLAACTMLAGRALQPLIRAVGIWTHLQAIRVAHERLEALFETPLETGYGGEDLAVAEGRLTLEDVHFAYDVRHPVVRGVTLDVAPGELVGIAGGNGSGKSTLLQLACGALVPDHGRVLIDGQPLAGVDRASFSTAVNYLPQVSTLFEGTILENLTMFRGPEHAEEALRLAAELGIDGFVSRLPGGYETRIDSSTHDQLPAGIRQAISLVRALVTRPRIVLFDEANMAFDQESDTRLQQMLRRLKGSVTVVMVTYRPSLLALADRSFRLDGGVLAPWDPAPGAHRGAGSAA